MIDRLTQRDVLHALMFWGRLVTSNGGRIHEHAIKRVVVSLIPLKLHPKRFWKKGNLVKIKATILSDTFQVIYVLKMIYQVSKKQCSTQVENEMILTPWKVILWSNPPPFWNFLGLWPPHPPGISNSLRGGGLDIFWNHTFQNNFTAEFWANFSYGLLAPTIFL